MKITTKMPTTEYKPPFIVISFFAHHEVRDANDKTICSSTDCIKAKLTCTALNHYYQNPPEKVDREDVETFGAKIRNKLSPYSGIIAFLEREDDKALEYARKSLPVAKQSLDKILSLCDSYSEHLTQLEAENKRLKTELLDATNTCNTFMQDNSVLTSENKRLRKALIKVEVKTKDKIDDLLEEINYLATSALNEGREG